MSHLAAGMEDAEITRDGHRRSVLPGLCRKLMNTLIKIKAV